MAITLDTLARALRVSVPLDGEQTAELTRLLGVSVEVVNKYAPNAPVVTTDEGVIRVAGYLFDAGSTTEPGAVGALNAIRLSGAAPLLAPYRVHRAGLIGVGGDSSSVVESGSSQDARVTAVDARVTAVDARVTAVDARVTTLEAAPAPSGGGATPTYTEIAGANVSSNRRQFDFNAAGRTAFVDAWNASTYHSFVVAILSGTDVTQYTLPRTPIQGDISGTVVFRLGVTVASATTPAEIHLNITGTAMKVWYASPNFYSTTAIIRIYGSNT